MSYPINADTRETLVELPGLQKCLERCVSTTETMAQILASLTRSSFHGAHARISGKIHRTPVVTSTTLSKLLQKSLRGYESGSREQDLELFFKCENLQMGGSFKIRGTTHFLTRLADADLRRGVVTYSTGELLISSHLHTLLLINAEGTMPGHSH
jgi:hypothetical protein